MVCAGYCSSGARPVPGDPLLAVVEKSVLVGYSPQQIFDLVDDVEHYPEFLPWCGGTHVISRDEQHTRATIRIAYHGIRQSFTTENAKQAPSLMEIRLIDGPFRQLDGTWRFVDLSGRGCRIEFRLHYESASRLLEKLVGPVFNYIANTFVESFIKRAERKYG
jgi:ribosome-associated toxin RatA of RatAB toxin-antitoxin module